MLSGEHLRTLNGHFDLVTGCVFRDASAELLTGGHDRQILAWVPEIDEQRRARALGYAPARLGIEQMEQVANNAVAAAAQDEDEWSSE